jgi:hypothetical protein
MSTTSAPAAGTNELLATITRLVTAADGDTLYRDVYLHRAAELLAPMISESQYDAALTRREQLTAILAQARAALGRQDWTAVRELGTRAAQLRGSLEGEQATLAAADAVYAAPPVVLDPLSPGISLSSPRWSSPEQARQDVSAALAALTREDAALSQLYASRQRTIDALPVQGAVGTSTASGPTGNLEQRALQALERGDIEAINACADAMLGNAAGSAAAARGAIARARLVAPGVLREPLPEACLARAKPLGLEAAEAPELSGELRDAVAQFIEQYALGASPAVHARATDGVARLKFVAEKVTIPPDVAAIFAETIALFALHVYVNSAGIRYVPPPIEREPLLIEPHPEGDDAATPLLRELHLDRRRGIARQHIEMHLRAHGPRILADQLGLDPRAFRLVCVPPDVYSRIGRDRGWGTREEWTHFDGYQVLSGGGMRALVGGNARYGGVFDLCSISRDDARENTVVRFAVIRRARFDVRFGTP